MNKPKIALYWCSSCGGCEESVIDLGEDLLKLAQSAEIIFWPAAMDARFSDLVALADGSILVSLINGAIQQEDHVNMARLLRKKSQVRHCERSLRTYWRRYRPGQSAPAGRNPSKSVYRRRDRSQSLQNNSRNSAFSRLSFAPAPEPGQDPGSGHRSGNVLIFPMLGPFGIGEKRHFQPS